MSRILLIAEHDHQQLRRTTLNAITAAAQLAQPIDVLLAGHDCQTVLDALAKVDGVAQIWYANDTSYQHPLAEHLTALALHCLQANNYRYVLAAATSFGKNLLPRIAAKKGVGMISDITAIIDQHTYERPIYAGNVLATVRSHDDVQVLSVRPTAFAAATAIAAEPAAVMAVDFVSQSQQSRWLSSEDHGGDRPELSSAQRVIAGGRGLQNQANFDRLGKIATRMGAALGASRAAVDAGLAPNDCQVGQTGQVVAPDIYFAVGISGAIQHLAGMKDSKIIVAINKDADAPIFQVADYGVVADIATVLPEWENYCAQLG